MWQQNYSELLWNEAIYWQTTTSLKKWETNVFFVSLLSSFHVHHFNIKWLLLNRSKPWVKWTLIAFNPRKIHTWEVPAFLPSLKACSSNLLRAYTLPAIEKCAFFLTSNPKESVCWGLSHAWIKVSDTVLSTEVQNGSVRVWRQWVIKEPDLADFTSIKRN